MNCITRLFQMMAFAMLTIVFTGASTSKSDKEAGSPNGGEDRAGRAYDPPSCFEEATYYAYPYEGTLMINGDLQQFTIANVSASNIYDAKKWIDLLIYIFPSFGCLATSLHRDRNIG